MRVSGAVSSGAQECAALVMPNTEACCACLSAFTGFSLSMWTLKCSGEDMHPKSVRSAVSQQVLHVTEHDAVCACVCAQQAQGDAWYMGSMRSESESEGEGESEGKSEGEGESENEGEGRVR